MELSDKYIQEFKDLAEKKGGKKISWEEARDGVYGLERLAQLAYDSWIEDNKRNKRLEESPKGYCLESVGYTCFICRASTPVGGNWYDKWGIKCLICQKAIDKKVIPPSLAKNEDSWYSTYDLESRFNIDRHAMKRFVKEEILKSRIVPNESGKPHAYLFLIKDNKDILPPKKLTESRMVEDEKDGKKWHYLEPWYKFVDPYKHLEGYKIMDYLRFTDKKEDEQK